MRWNAGDTRPALAAVQRSLLTRGHTRLSDGGAWLRDEGRGFAYGRALARAFRMQAMLRSAQIVGPYARVAIQHLWLG